MIRSIQNPYYITYNFVKIIINKYILTINISRFNYRHVNKYVELKSDSRLGIPIIIVRLSKYIIYTRFYKSQPTTVNFCERGEQRRHSCKDEFRFDGPRNPFSSPYSLRYCRGN